MLEGGAAGAARCRRDVADVAELVDALDLGSSDENRGGSSPFVRTSAAPPGRSPQQRVALDKMQVTETSADGLKRELTIVIPAAELEEKVTSRLQQLGRSIRLPGFRPGKVPQQLLRQRYGNAVRGEVLEGTLQDSSAEAMREHNLRPALPPRVEIVSAAEGADFEYKISVEVLPDMPEPDFAALGLERLVVEIPDADVNTAVERIAEQYRKSEPVKRGAKSGDLLTADVVGKVGDQEIPGTKAEGRTIELGAEGLLPGFTDQLTGVKAEQQRAVKVTLPENYGNPEFAGKEAVFEVAVKEVRERQKAVIDDALAKEIGLETLAELRQEVRDRIGRDYSMVTRQRLKRGLLDALAEKYEFPVPPGMVEIEFNSIWQQHEAEKAYAAGQAPGAPPAEEAAGETPGPGAGRTRRSSCCRPRRRRREAQNRIPGSRRTAGSAWAAACRSRPQCQYHRHSGRAEPSSDPGSPALSRL